jgi:hypothetical protein
MDRYYCPLGPRTIRADIEYLRLGRENIRDEQVAQWLRNRALICDRIVEFYSTILSGTNADQKRITSDFLSYAKSAQIILWHAASGTPSTTHQSHAPPRGEIIKELIRPLIKFSELFPKYKLRIRHGILESRAIAYGYSIKKFTWYNSLAF